MDVVNNGLSPAVLDALNGGTPAAARSKSTDEELRDNFMTLLITQLQNQDPLKPMENAELTSQLAQINTVSGINALNDTLNGITAQIDAGQSLQAAQLIGNGVLIEGNRVLVGEEGAATPFGVELNAPVNSLKATITGADGSILSEMNLGAVSSGVRSFMWDGKLASGEYAAPGSYNVRLEGLDADGNVMPMKTLKYAMVYGVSSSDANGVKLDLGGLADPIRLDEVRQIL